MNPSWRADRRRLVVGIILTTILIVGSALRVLFIDIPGPQGDEVYMPYVALQVVMKEPIGQPKANIFGYQLPLTIGPYTGALPVYVYIILLKIIRHPLLFRFVNIFYAMLSIVLVFALARQQLGSHRAGLIAASLFAVMPAPIFYSRIGEFAVFLRVPISIGVLLLSYRFFETGKRVYLYGACLVLGLGVNTRLEMLWWAPAIVAWMAVTVSWEKFTNVHPFSALRTGLLGTIAFLIGSLPFAVYVLQDWTNLMQYFQSNLTVTRAGADNRLLWQNLSMRFWQLFALIDGRALQEMGAPALQNPVNGFLFLCAILFGLVMIVKGLVSRRRLQGLELLFCCTAVILVESIVTLSVFKPWHILVLLPLAILIITFMVNKVVTWHKNIGLALVGVLLLSNVIVTAKDYKALLGWRGRGGFSPGIYDLVSHLEDRRIQRVVTGDWGLARLIYFLSNANVKTREIFIYAPHPPIPSWFYDRLAEETGPGTVWVFYTSHYSDVGAQEAFLRYLRGKGVQYDLTTLRDLHGPLFNIYRIGPQDSEVTQ
jgi:4-amino-4-deoxy-L-arabinose transferase-like glycosyltransferase